MATFLPNFGKKSQDSRFGRDLADVLNIQIFGNLHIWTDRQITAVTPYPFYYAPSCSRQFCLGVGGYVSSCPLIAHLLSCFHVMTSPSHLHLWHDFVFDYLCSKGYLSSKHASWRVAFFINGLQCLPRFACICFCIVEEAAPKIGNYLVN